MTGTAMKFWCGDYETDDWVIGLPVETLLFWVVVLVVVGVAGWWWYSYINKQKDKEAAAKKVKDEEDAAKKKKADDEARTKLIADTKKGFLNTLDDKLRSLQDGHRAVMISDNYNRVMWIAEGVRQARDAIEHSDTVTTN